MVLRPPRVSGPARDLTCASAGVEHESFLPEFEDAGCDPVHRPSELFRKLRVRRVRKQLEDVEDLALLLVDILELEESFEARISYAHC